MAYANSLVRRSAMFSYLPIPFYQDAENVQSQNTKLDLNLHCIKRPQQTCFIRVSNPNLLTWGIEAGDILVVEKQDKLALNDLVVLNINGVFHLFDFTAYDKDEFLFMALDARQANIRTRNLSELNLVGTVTNTVHQLKPKRNAMRFAA